GGLLTNSEACMAFMLEYPVLPIWGVQREQELTEWLSFFDRDVVMTEEIREYIAKDREELLGDFCRGCGYCAPCTVGIQINNCARMSQLIRRSPSAQYLGEEWQGLMMKIEQCVDCGICKTRCPYELDIPTLLRKNLEDYKSILNGEAALN
ncbi:MAG: 4Fe-4S dicluster domain-containing protein, partial [Lachnospiraceae bacterium]|nr:4Fe-4S dicluster domain-containing protein [Lachnospiraceae bacterium]